MSRYNRKNERRAVKTSLTTHQSGQTALVAMLTIGVIVLVLGVSVAVRGSIAVLSSRRGEQSDASFFAAQAGIEDAREKLTRNKEFCGDGAGCALHSYNDDVTNCAINKRTDISPVREYSISVGSVTVCVEVTAGGSTLVRSITSRATVGGTTRKLTMTCSVHGASGDPANPTPSGTLVGVVDSCSWDET